MPGDLNVDNGKGNHANNVGGAGVGLIHAAADNIAIVIVRPAKHKSSRLPVDTTTAVVALSVIVGSRDVSGFKYLVADENRDGSVVSIQNTPSAVNTGGHGNCGLTGRQGVLEAESDS